MGTTGDSGLARGQEYDLVEEMKAGEARAGKETKTGIPYGRRGMIDLENGDCMEVLEYRT
jgi:hypothetical protein